MPALMEGRTLSATQARQRFFEVLDQVREGGSVTIHQATRDDDVVMVPKDLLFAIVGAVTVFMASRMIDDAKWRTLIKQIWGETGVPEPMVKQRRQEVRQP